MKEKPLVSILVPNFNYGGYLAECLDSALNQSYENIEVVFVDNNSSDDSYDIALDFRARFKDRLRVYRNDENIGGSRNHAKAYSMMDPRAQCYIFLSSDDLLHPTLVERSMGIMEQYPSVGFVIIHRYGIDEKGCISHEIPFYNCDCVIPSTKQMEVFMMAGIGVCTQCFRNRHLENACGIAEYTFDISGDWFSNFCIATISDMGYIKDPLCGYRTHSSGVTNRAIRDLTNSVEHILMVNAFREIADRLNRPSVSARLTPALEKLGTMCLRYCAQLLHEDDAYNAERYLHLASVLKPNIREDFSWQTLWRLAKLNAGRRQEGLKTFIAGNSLKRLVSYDPPEESIRL